MRKKNMIVPPFFLVPTKLMRKLGTENIADVFRFSVELNNKQSAVLSQETSSALSPISFKRNPVFRKGSMNRRVLNFNKTIVKKKLEQKNTTANKQQNQKDYILLVDEGTKPIQSGAYSVKVNAPGLDSNSDSSGLEENSVETLPIHISQNQINRRKRDYMMTPKPSQFKKFPCPQRHKKLSVNPFGQVNEGSALKSSLDIKQGERKTKWYEKKERIIKNQYYLRNFALSSKGNNNEHLKLSHLVHFTKRNRRRSTLTELLKICHSTGNLTHKVISNAGINSNDSLSSENFSYQGSEDLNFLTPTSSKQTWSADSSSARIKTDNRISSYQSPFAPFVSMSYIPSPKY